jgi:hypothetical protein
MKAVNLLLVVALFIGIAVVQKACSDFFERNAIH